MKTGGNNAGFGLFEGGTASAPCLVLVVDDDIALQLLVRESLEPKGFEVEEATDGEAALKALSRLRPDIVLLDVNMPKADGFTVCAGLRQMPEHANTPVVMMTAADDVDAIHTAYDVGATDFITKPLNWILLAYRLRYVLRASQTLERLAVNEARLARAQQIARLGDWEFDLGTRMIISSGEVRRIFGLDTDGARTDIDAFLGRVHPEDRDMLSKALDAVTPVAPAGLDVRVVLPAGEERVAHFRTEVLRDEHAQPRRVLATVQDVTERTWLELQLRQAQKMEALGKLAGGIAHDFNNLLTVINLRTGLLLGGPQDSASVRRDGSLIREAAEAGAALTRQLLAFSRKQVLERKAIDLNAAVIGVEALVRQLIGEHIAPALRLAPQLAAVLADRSQMEQVILNLVVNARDAMPDGGELLISTTTVDLDAAFVRSHPGSQPGPHVALAIRDTGVGMDAAVRARIFEPFFTTKGPEQGTGLGLATVYGIVKENGGYIAVESEPGRGSTFTVYLAAIPSAADGGEPAAPAEDLSARQGTETVLLAEDDSRLRAVALDVLQGSGYTVIEACHGRHAFNLARAHQGRIDLLLTDVLMPEMSGPELVRQLTSAGQQVKVLFVSGYPDDAFRRYQPEMQAAAFLAKPFTPERLLGKVREVLDAPELCP